jgi:hypothetical protein
VLSLSKGFRMVDRESAENFGLLQLSSFVTNELSCFEQINALCPKIDETSVYCS